RSTLLVRIMAAGPVLADALAELLALPADAHERVVAEDVVVHLQHRLGRKPSRTQDEEEFIVAIQSTWEKARKEALDEGRNEGGNEGRNEGRAEARASDVLTVLRVRGVAVSEAAREHILAEKDSAQLERWLERAAVAASVDQVFDEPS